MFKSRVKLKKNFKHFNCLFGLEDTIIYVYVEIVFLVGIFLYALKNQQKNDFNYERSRDSYSLVEC